MTDKRVAYLMQIGFIIGFIGCVMKVTGAVDWSWLWITFPLWVFPANLLVMLATVAIMSVVNVAVAELESYVATRRARRKQQQP